MTNEENHQQICGKCKEFIERWAETQHFLLWEYLNKHLSIDDEDPIHCCHFGLNGFCMHNNDHQSSCRKCSDTLVFFSKIVKPILDDAKNVLALEEDQREMQTVMNSIPIFDKAVRK